jgi:hypothetical protein
MINFENNNNNNNNKDMRPLKSTELNDNYIFRVSDRPIQRYNSDWIGLDWSTTELKLGHIPSICAC